MACTASVQMLPPKPSVATLYAPPPTAALRHPAETDRRNAGTQFRLSARPCPTSAPVAERRASPRHGWHGTSVGRRAVAGACMSGGCRPPVCCRTLVRVFHGDLGRAGPRRRDVSGLGSPRPATQDPVDPARRPPAEVGSTLRDIFAGAIAWTGAAPGSSTGTPRLEQSTPATGGPSDARSHRAGAGSRHHAEFCAVTPAIGQTPGQHAAASGPAGRHFNDGSSTARCVGGSLR